MRKKDKFSVSRYELNKLLMSYSDTIEMISENDANTIYGMTRNEMQEMLNRLIEVEKGS